MTIAAAYLVSEGVVLGADSITTISAQTPQPGVLQLLHHSQKIFEVGENSRIGVCTWGDGTIGDFSHRTIIAQLADKVKDDSTITIEGAAEELINIIDSMVKREKIKMEFVGYFLGGWNPGTHEPDCWKIEISKDGNNKEKLDLGLCSFAGMPNVFTRVFRGFDPAFPDQLREEIKALITNQETKDKFDEIFKEAFEKASGPLIAAGYKDLPIREAIDFVYSYLHITIKAIKFRFGAPLCGGPIEIGFVSTDRPFRWACHKTFTSAILEQEGKYDVE